MMMTGIYLQTNRAITLFLTALLIFASLPPQAIAQTTLRALRAEKQAAKPPKLAPDLEEILAQDDEGQRQALTGKTLAQIRSERGANKQATPDTRTEDETPLGLKNGRGILLPSAQVGAEARQSFIVQTDGTTPNVVLQENLARLGGRISQQHSEMGLLTIEAPRSILRQLAAEGSISYVSPDRPVLAQAGHLERTTGAMDGAIDPAGKALYGVGIGIAIIDSGIDETHTLIKAATGHPGVIFKKDFTGQNLTADNYGHGTHVATIAAGRKDLYSAAYRGVAPAAKLLDLRVLNDAGAGAASSVIAALDWCITNKAAHNIRVINLSLGTMAKDSYKTDPLCLAARRAVNAGIVVVAAAGNDGKAANGSKIYGSIHSPGIDPSVITVGAANTMGSDKRSDDQVASYSSRGPTRSYTTVNGVRKYDNLIKPDIIAPGNKLIGACSTKSRGRAQSLIESYPSLKAGTAATAADEVMYLSGTSMSAPVVAGGVAMLLEANPTLTPSLVKAILMYTAQPLNGFNMLEQGAGLFNVKGAAKLVARMKSNVSTLSSGAALLTASLPIPDTTIMGETFQWGQGVITNYGFLYGSNLMTKWQSVYGSGQILGDATTYANGALSLVSGKTASVSFKSGAVTINGNGIILGDSANPLFASGTVLGDGVVLSDGVVLGDGVVLSDGIILGDGTTRADCTLKSASGASILGDNTACMQPARPVTQDD